MPMFDGSWGRGGYTPINSSRNAQGRANRALDMQQQTVGIAQQNADTNRLLADKGIGYGGLGTRGAYGQGIQAGIGMPRTGMPGTGAPATVAPPTRPTAQTTQTAQTAQAQVPGAPGTSLAYDTSMYDNSMQPTFLGTNFLNNDQAMPNNNFIA